MHSCYAYCAFQEIVFYWHYNEITITNCCFVTRYNVTLKWNNLVILMWPSLVTPQALHCDETPKKVTIKTHTNSQVTNIWRLVWNHHAWSFKTCHHKTSFCCHLGNRHFTTIMLTLQRSVQLKVLWELRCDFIIKSSGWVITKPLSWCIISWVPKWRVLR